MDKEVYEWLFDLGDVEVEGINPSLKYVGRLTVNLEFEEEDDEREEERTYVYFFGIPYAMPPVEERRFQPPEPYQPEEGLEVYEAFHLKPKCYQLRLPEYEIVGSEDCLYLNIYIPKNPVDIEEPLAVLVYFHGGALKRGSGNYDERTPDSLMKEDIILVTVNYRLGVFGFLNLRSNICQGNAGLKDQVMALQWIKNNITAFGGNPENVTICGESAGGSCVNFHLISPMSRGLFHKAIVQSGGIFCPWGFTGHHRKRIRRFKEYRKQEHYSRDLVVEDLLKLGTEDLRKTYQQFINQERRSKYEMSIYLGPSSEIQREGAFIFCDKVEDLIKQIQPVPILAGIDEKEGYMALGNYPGRDWAWLKNREEFIKFLEVNTWRYEETAAKHVDELRNKYFPNISEMNDDELAEHLVKFSTDLWFYRFYDNFNFGNTNATDQKQPLPRLYVYKFNFVTEMNYSWETYLGTNANAAGHGDECCYLFPPLHLRKHYTPFRPHILSKVKSMCSLWANFCKEGSPKSSCHPDLNWSPHTKSNPCYLRIDNDGLRLEEGPLNGDWWKFMKELVLPEDVISSSNVTPSTPSGCSDWPIPEHVETLQGVAHEMQVASSTVTSTSSECTRELSDQTEGGVGEEDRGSSEVAVAIPGLWERPSTLA